MREHVLNDFKYSLEPSSVSGYQCVEVTFLFDEKVTKRFIYIKNDPSVNYIQKAKQIIKHELETGELIKYAKKYHRRYYKKPILIGLTVFFLIVAGVSTGLLAYHYLNKGSVTPKPKPTPTTDTVELVVSNPQPGYGLDLKNKSSTVGKEYDTDFVFTHPAHDVTYCLPSNLDQVKVGDNTITTGYTYDLGSDKFSAHLTIPANLVTGKIKITLTLAFIPPITGIKILPTDDCENVSIPEQGMDPGDYSTFNVTIIPNTATDVVIIEKIEFGNISLSYNHDDYTFELIGNNIYKIDFNGEEYSFESDIFITAEASIETIRTLSFDDMVNLALYDKEGAQINNPVSFSSKEKLYIYLDTTQQIAENTPLGIKIEYLNANPDGREQLILGEEYQYRFINNTKAEIVIFPGEGDINIYAETTSAITSFMYRAPAHSSETITLDFYSANQSAVDVCWDVLNAPMTKDELSSDGGHYTVMHTFTNEEEYDVDYVVGIYQHITLPMPTAFGFDVYDDVFSDKLTKSFPQINEPIAPYSSGIKNVTAIKLYDNCFENFTAEGLMHTNIESLYWPLGLSLPSTSSNGRFAAYCTNLNYFYTAGSNDKYVASPDRKMLLTLLDEYDNLPVIVSIANKPSVVIDDIGGKPVVAILPYTCIGRNLLTKLTVSADGLEYGTGAFIDCANLKTINVHANDFIQGDNINMLVNSERGYVHLGCKNTDLTVLSRDSISILPFAFSSASPKTIKWDKTVSLDPFAFYHAASLSNIALGTTRLNGVEDNENAYFYNCPNLTSVIFNSLDNGPDAPDKCPIIGIIQKCPNVTTLSIKNEQVGGPYVADKNAIYYIDTNDFGSYASLVGTCSKSIIQESVKNYWVNSFADCVLNGNRTEEVLIPDINHSSYSYYKFVGCNGCCFESVSDYYEVYNREDASGNVIESIVYDTSDSTNTVIGVSLLNDNTVVIIPDTIDVLAKCSISYSPVTEIIFEHTTQSLSFNQDHGFVCCYNLRKLNFSNLVVESSSDVPTLAEDYFNSDWYYQNIKVMVKDETAKELFLNNGWGMFGDNIISVS